MSDRSPSLSDNAQAGVAAQLEALVHSPLPEILTQVANDSRLTEDLALALLKRRDLPREVLEALSKNNPVATQPKVRLGLVTHPRTPGFISLPLIRHLYSLELMQVALLPGVVPEVKRAAEEVLIGRLGTISSGERYTLAKRASGRVAAALLTDKEERVLGAALLNPKMTEAFIVKCLRAEIGTELLAPAVARHPKWVHRTEIKSALLGNRNTPAARLPHLASELPRPVLQSLLRDGKLAPKMRQVIQELMKKRSRDI